MGTSLVDATPSASQESDEWKEIRLIIEAHIANQPRNLQKEIGPSELGTDCLHCLAARLAGWEKHQSAAWLPFIGTCVHSRFEHLFNGRKDEFTVPDDDGGEPWAVKRFDAERHVDVGSIHGLHGHQRIHGSIDLYDAETTRPSTGNHRPHHNPQRQSQRSKPAISHTGEPVRHRIGKRRRTLQKERDLLPAQEQRQSGRRIAGRIRLRPETRTVGAQPRATPRQPP